MVRQLISVPGIGNSVLQCEETQIGNIKLRVEGKKETAMGVRTSFLYIVFVLLLFFITTLVFSLPAHSSVKVTIGPVADENKYFLVETGYNYHVLDGNRSKALDKRLVASPGSNIIPVNFYNPILFHYVYAAVYHPAYIFETKSLKKMPFHLRRVSLPVFHPRQWRDLMNSGEKIEKAGPNVHIGHVLDHLRLFVGWYIPAMDDAGKKEDLGKHLPLFKDLIEYTKKVSPHTQYNDKSIDTKILEDPEYAKRMYAMEQGKLKELDTHLREIESMLSLSTEKRMTLRRMQANMFKTKVIYYNLMTEQDRQRLRKCLEDHHRGHITNERSVNRDSWKNTENNITYSVKIGNRYTFKKDKDKEEFQECIGTTINVDLSTTVDVELRNLKKEVSANFCRKDQEWQLQLIGAENW
jgi:hypothetical protein